MMLPDWAGYQRYRPQFEQIINPEFYPIEWLDFEVSQGRAWPIIGDKSALIIEVKAYPGGVRACHGLIAAGDLEEIANDLIPAAEEWGRAKGCKYGLIESREGWAKILKSHGWFVHQISILKEL